MSFVLICADPARPGVVELRAAPDPATVVSEGLGPVRQVPEAELAGVVAAIEEAEGPRWVWDDTERWYPGLLAAGVRVRRAHDLRLCHAILRRSTRTAGTRLALAPHGPWDDAAPAAPVVEPPPPSLFDDWDRPEPAAGLPDPAAELRAQLGCLAEAGDDGRLRLLLAAESAGALIADELRFDGLPFRADLHDALLTERLGPRPAEGARPAVLQSLAEQIAAALDRPGLNPDSPPELLRALRAAGIDVASTRKWELRGHDHPAIEPLLTYKKLARLLSANGWAWLDRWVSGGRFRPDYVPAGVVTGRWASSGGGALQLPAGIRAAVRADPGRVLVVADAAQLEPRVLAAMSGDRAMAAAGQQADLYQAVVQAGIVEDRQQAKYAMLGAIYGATTGASAVLMPQLARGYPQAVEPVEQAARAGERGEQVTTWLGRSSPLPSADRLAERLAAAGEGGDESTARDARRHARDWGRFTRNFVVQGTAAEWALCWMAVLRQRLIGLPGRPHLVFFLHDELMVHSPVDQAERVAAAVREAAEEAGRLLFGDTPVEFALDLSIVDSYDQA
ncbi:bifunctional 3'-5' exonuclease/DNA polymerase [Cellulomonas denverensis]|uniref:DNA-directed DNA polymerase n=1 Tax=Cellulomonas denverensis TaxID=264297 RepID=A0A7X6KTR4_9CELL|nr:bifunctional 3'-5' exonuclease/DNA polymerase [Cellulomonas denverensis]NKY22137.1 bifunctional 3'-5' exonuclease/DNA polymerase [Cellulomonas denverensis]